jgi:hypothetical protein
VVCGDLGLELCILPGIAPVQGRADDGDRPAAGRHRGAVRGGVNPRGKPAHDDDVVLSKNSRKACGASQRRRACLTRSDDAHSSGMAKQ